MSQLSTPSPQRIRAASDASLWDSDNVDPFDAYAAQQDAELERRRVSDILSQFTVAPAGAGTGAAAATPSARPAGVGTASSPRRSASSASPSSRRRHRARFGGGDQHGPQFDHASHHQRPHHSNGRNALAATVQHHGSRFGRVRGHVAIRCLRRPWPRLPAGAGRRLRHPLPHLGPRPHPVVEVDVDPTFVADLVPSTVAIRTACDANWICWRKMPDSRPETDAFAT